MIAFLIVLGYVVIGLAIGAYVGRNVYRAGGFYAHSGSTRQNVRPGDTNGALMYACWGAAIWPFWILLGAVLWSMFCVEWFFNQIKPLLTRIFIGRVDKNA